ncbi:MAG: TetR/AcrR family transcriptional regulator [Oceanospirillaceae bacterium]|nr:TetR/AcrR family transcriptional regulator [Oceanospirillaceae bacterium]
MSGLREQQKARRRHVISASAIALFDSQGYQATTMEQIARAAGVSVPTVFAYFGSKQEILLEMLREADRQAFSDTRQLMECSGDPVGVLVYLERRLIETAFESLSPALWLEILPLLVPSLGENRSGLPEAYQNVNEVLILELRQLLRDMQASGSLRADLDLDYVAQLVNDYSHLLMWRMVRSETLDMEAHLEASRRFLTLLFEGMRAVD